MTTDNTQPDPQAADHSGYKAYAKMLAAKAINPDKSLKANADLDDLETIGKLLTPKKPLTPLATLDPTPLAPLPHTSDQSDPSSPPHNPIPPTLPAPADDDEYNTPIAYEYWEALAYDLALENTSANEIAKAYGFTLQEFNELLINPYFQKLLQTKRDEVKQLGSDADFTAKMRMIVTRATPAMLARLTDSETPTREFHALYKTAVELARLAPEPQQSASSSMPAQASITLNISGVPGLEHLATTPPQLQTQPIEEAQVIQPTPLNQPLQLQEL